MAKRDKIIRELLTDGFSRDELKILALDVGANPENIFSEGATLPVTARELLAWCYRRNKVKDLLNEVKEKNPEKYKQYQERLQLSEQDNAQLENARGEEDIVKEAYDELRTARTTEKEIGDEKTSPRKAKHPLAGDQRAVKAYFSKLEDAQKAFVVVSALFNGLQREEIMLAYVEALKLLDVHKATSLEEE